MVVELSWWEENVSNSEVIMRIRSGSVVLQVVIIVSGLLTILLIILAYVVWRLKKRADANRAEKERIEM